MDMDAIIAAAGDGFIEFIYPEGDQSSNDMDIEAIPALTNDGAVIYSAYLFMGIKLLCQNQVQTFNFYRAIDTFSANFTVAIAAVDNQNQVLYLGELSGLIP
jgi:hypothetical protein